MTNPQNHDPREPRPRDRGRRTVAGSDDARTIFERDQLDAAAASVARQLIGTATRSGKPLVDVPADELAGIDPQAAAVVTTFVALRKAGAITPCDHLRANPLTTSWWTTAARWALWCGQQGCCDHLTVYKTLGRCGHLPAQCFICQKPAPRIGLKVACDSTLLKVHLCRKHQKR